MRGNNVCFQKVCHWVYKKMDVLTKQRHSWKFCMRLKKSKVETIALLKEAFQNETLYDLIIRRWHRAFTDGRGKPRWSLDAFRRRSLKLPLKKMGRKNGNMFSCKQMVFWERKCQMYSLGKWGWCEWVNLSFCSFFLSFFFFFFNLEWYTQLFSQNQL